MKLHGKEHKKTLHTANNYSILLASLKRFQEAKVLLREVIPVARRVLGDSDDITLRMGWMYAAALALDDGATLDDLREAVASLEDTARTARRVLGSTHPITKGIEHELQLSRAALGGSSKGSN